MLDDTEKPILFELLEAGKGVSVKLTERNSMSTASSVSKTSYAHHDSHYFAVIKIGNKLKILRNEKNNSG